MLSGRIRLHPNNANILTNSESGFGNGGNFRGEMRKEEYNTLPHRLPDLRICTRVCVVVVEPVDGARASLSLSPIWLDSLRVLCL